MSKGQESLTMNDGGTSSRRRLGMSSWHVRIWFSGCGSIGSVQITLVRIDPPVAGCDPLSLVILDPLPLTAFDPLLLVGPLPLVSFDLLPLTGLGMPSLPN